MSSQALSNHGTGNTQHSGTSVVDLGIELAGLFFGVEVLSEPANSVVTIVLGSRHPCEFDKSEECKDLEESGVGDGTDSVNSGRDIGEFKFLRRGNVSIEDNVVVVNDHSDDGSHTDTSVLSLDSPTTFERLGLGFEPSKRIVNTQRSGDSDLEFIDIQCSRGLSLLDRGECSRGGDKRGKDGGLHFVFVINCLNLNGQKYRRREKIRVLLVMNLFNLVDR